MKRLKIMLEGDFLTVSSIAHINRSIIENIAGESGVEFLIKTQEDLNSYIKNKSDYRVEIKTQQKEKLFYQTVKIKEGLVKKMVEILVDEGKSYEDLDFYIYHRWPLRFNPPALGYFIIMQPWEFGSLPLEWISSFNDFADDIWVYSNYLKETYISSGINPGKISVIHPFIDISVFRKSDQRVELGTNKKFKFLFVGGTIHRKGIDVLLNAYLSAFTNKDDVCLVIKDVCTNSAYAGQTISKTIEKISVNKNFAEVLYIKDEYRTENQIVSLYNSCDCLVHPYRAEGFGLPVAEAMACGLPVIVTNYGACMDFCNMKNAFLVESKIEISKEKRIGDIVTIGNPFWAEPDIASLKDNMQYLYNNYDVACAKAKVAYNDIREKFTWENTYNQMKSSFDKLSEREIKRFSKFVSSVVIPNSDIKKNVKTMCDYYINKCKIDKAIKTIYEYLVNDPNDDEFLNLIATYLYRVKQYHIALLYINKAFKLSGPNETVKKNMTIIKSAIEKDKDYKITGNADSESYSYLKQFIEKIESKKTTIAVCMIVKNEEKNLPKCLKSLKGIASEIIIVDTGSTDRTVDIARTYGATVKSMVWNDDFSEARNLSIKDVKSDWILYLDADEYIDNSSKVFFENLITANRAKAYYIKIVSLLSEDNDDIFTEHYMVRLFNNKFGFKFKDFIHEQLILENGDDYEREVSPVILWHSGYLKKVVGERNKNERNYNLLLKAIETNPDNPFNYYNMGINLFSIENHQEAIKYFDLTVEKLDGRQTAYLPFCYSFKSSCYSSLGRYNQAVEEAKEALKISPDFKEAYFNLANAYYYINEFEKAIINFKNALEVKDVILLGGVLDKGVSSWKTYNGMGITYLKMADYENSINYLEKAYEHEKKSPMIILNLVVAHKMKGDIDRIEKILSCLNGILFSVTQAQQLTNILLLFDRYESAVRVLSEILNYYKENNIPEDENGFDPNLLKNNIAEIFFAKGNYKEANIWYEEFFKDIKFFSCPYKEALKKYSVSAFLIGELLRAEEYIDRTLKIDVSDATNDWEIYHNAGAIKSKLSKTDEAITYLKKAINLNNSSTQSYIELGRVFINTGQFKTANEILKNEPSFATEKPSLDVLLLNSEALFKMRDFEEAIKNLLIYISFDENDCVYNRLGMCYQNIKNYNEAAYCFSKAIDFNNQNPSYFANLGNCFSEVKDFEDAKLAYECALLLDHEYLPAVIGMQSLEIEKSIKI